MKKSKYKVEKNIPIPPHTVPWSKFPFAYMEVGDSFFVTKEQEKKSSLLQLRAMLYSKAKKYIIDASVNYKFSYHVDRINKGVRVFRIE
jgi:hypothetical protein